MTPRVFFIEGLDRLGKSTLIDGILNTLGYYEVIHFSKPRHLAIYDELAKIDDVLPISEKHRSEALYQNAGFVNMMHLTRGEGHIIFDRAHLGEFVYSPLYRGYSGEYVFDLEKLNGLDVRDDLRLILLTENLEKSTHFVDDGQSLGPAEKRREEQAMFVKAFYRSNIKDKRMISVTNAEGGFRPKDDILAEALA
jgi:thymidylate kinase